MSGKRPENVRCENCCYWWRQDEHFPMPGKTHPKLPFVADDWGWCRTKADFVKARHKSYGCGGFCGDWERRDETA